MGICFMSNKWMEERGVPVRSFSGAFVQLMIQLQGLRCCEWAGSKTSSPCEPSRIVPNTFAFLTTPSRVPQKKTHARMKLPNTLAIAVASWLPLQPPPRKPCNKLCLFCQGTNVRPFASTNKFQRVWSSRSNRATQRQVGTHMTCCLLAIVSGAAHLHSLLARFFARPHKGTAETH